MDYESFLGVETAQALSELWIQRKHIVRRSDKIRQVDQDRSHRSMVFDLDRRPLERLAKALKSSVGICDEESQGVHLSLPLPLMAIQLGSRFSLSLVVNGSRTSFLSGDQRTSIAAHILVGYVAEELGCEADDEMFAVLWQEFVKKLKVVRADDLRFDKSSAASAIDDIAAWRYGNEITAYVNAENESPVVPETEHLVPSDNIGNPEPLDINNFLSEALQKISCGNHDLEDILPRWKSLWGEMSSSFLVILDHDSGYSGREIIEAEMSSFLLSDAEDEEHFIHFCDESSSGSSGDAPSPFDPMNNASMNDREKKRWWPQFLERIGLADREVKINVSELYSPCGSVYLEHRFPPGVVVADASVRNGVGEAVRKPKIELFKSGNAVHVFGWGLEPQSYYVHVMMQPEISGLHIPVTVISFLLTIVLGFALFRGRPENGDVASAIATSIVLFPGFLIALLSVQERSGFDRVFVRRVKGSLIFLSVAAIVSAIVIARASEVKGSGSVDYYIIYACFAFSWLLAAHHELVVFRVYLERRIRANRVNANSSNEGFSGMHEPVTGWTTFLLMLNAAVTISVFIYLFKLRAGWILK